MAAMFALLPAVSAFPIGQAIVSSSDLGVHKCEFEGQLGTEPVRLYIFLTACISPGHIAQPPPSPLPSNRSSTDHASQPAPAAAAAAAATPDAVAELWISGVTFMLPLNQPVNTTQLQQPLTTLLWAAADLPAPFDGGTERSEQPNRGGAAAADGGPGGSNSSGSSADGGGGSTGRREVLSAGAEAGTGAAAVGAAAAALRWAAGDMEGELLWAAPRLAGGTDRVLAIRSRTSSRQYGIHLSYRETSNWAVNPSLRREPGRLTARIPLDAAELVKLSAPTSQTPDPAGSGTANPDPVFQIRAAGFPGTCSYTPSRGKRPAEVLAPSSVMNRSSAAAATAAGGTAPANATRTGLVVGAPICAWADPVRQAHENSLQAFWRSLQVAGESRSSSRRPKRRRRRPKRKWRRRRQPPPPPPPPPANAYRPPTYMVISPYFNLTPYDFVTLLSHHVSYHVQLGVQRYLVYIEEEGHEAALAADERLAAMAAAGRVTLVRWRELPTFRLPGSDVRHPYASQILAYNHALLALWHEAAVVAVADLDEYLMTSQSGMNLEQTLLLCAPAGRHPPAALWVPRRTALCSSCWAAHVADQPATKAALAVPEGANYPRSQDLQALAEMHVSNATLAAAAATLERGLWLRLRANTRTSAAASASSGSGGGGGGGGGGNDTPRHHHHHPLSHYRHWRQGWHHKSLMYSHLVSYFGVHLTYSAGRGGGGGDGGEGFRRRPQSIAKSGCAVWAHLETQLGPRDRSAPPMLQLLQQGERHAQMGEHDGGGNADTYDSGAGAASKVRVGQPDKAMAEEGPGSEDNDVETRASGGEEDGLGGAQEDARVGAREGEGGEEDYEDGEEDVPGGGEGGDGFKGDAAADGSGSGRSPTPVLAVESRYFWALEAAVGQKLPRVQYWGQRGADELPLR